MEFNINKEEFVCANCKHFTQHYIKLSEEETKCYRPGCVIKAQGCGFAKLLEGHCKPMGKRLKKTSVTNEACYAFERREE